MGTGGVIPPPATYFEKIQQILREYAILFVVDEVICGFGRTGRMFSTRTYSLHPDMITMAKPLLSGYLPILALMVSENIYRVMVEQSKKFGVFGHWFTFGGHPVSSAVALETQRVCKSQISYLMCSRFRQAFKTGLEHLRFMIC